MLLRCAEEAACIACDNVIVILTRQFATSFHVNLVLTLHILYIHIFFTLLGEHSVGTEPSLAYLRGNWWLVDSNLQPSRHKSTSLTIRLPFGICEWLCIKHHGGLRESDCSVFSIKELKRKVRWKKLKKGFENNRYHYVFFKSKRVPWVNSFFVEFLGTSSEPGHNLRRYPVSGLKILFFQILGRSLLKQVVRLLYLSWLFIWKFCKENKNPNDR